MCWFSRRVAHPSLTHPATDEFNLFRVLVVGFSYKHYVFNRCFCYLLKIYIYIYIFILMGERGEKKTCLIFARPTQPLFSVVSRPDFDKVTMGKHRDASGKKPTNII